MITIITTADKHLGKRTKITTYHIRTIKKQPCLISSVNIMYTKTKRGIRSGKSDCLGQI